MLRRLEQNRQAAKRAYNKRIAKQTSDADKIRESEHELKQLRLVVEQQQQQIKVLNAVVGLMKDNSPLQLRELLKKHEEEGKLNDSGQLLAIPPRGAGEPPGAPPLGAPPLGAPPQREPAQSDADVVLGALGFLAGGEEARPPSAEVAAAAAATRRSAVPETL